MPGLRERVRVIGGALNDGERIREAVAGSDAVVIALGPRQDHPEAFCADATERIIEAMKEHQVRRLLYVTGALIGADHTNRGLFYRMMRCLLVKRVPRLMRDRDEQERLVRMSGLDWTVFKPPRLINGPDGPINTGQDVSTGLFARTTVDSLARAMLDELMERRSVGKLMFPVSR